MNQEGGPAYRKELILAVRMGVKSFGVFINSSSLSWAFNCWAFTILFVDADLPVNM